MLNLVLECEIACKLDSDTSSRTSDLFELNSQLMTIFESIGIFDRKLSFRRKICKEYV